MAFLKPPFALTLHTVKKENKKTSKGVYRNRFEHLTHSLEAPMLLPTAEKNPGGLTSALSDLETGRWWRESAALKPVWTGLRFQLIRTSQHRTMDVTFKKTKSNKKTRLPPWVMVKRWCWCVCRKTRTELWLSGGCFFLKACLRPLCPLQTHHIHAAIGNTGDDGHSTGKKVHLGSNIAFVCVFRVTWTFYLKKKKKKEIWSTPQKWLKLTYSFQSWNGFTTYTHFCIKKTKKKNHINSVIHVDFIIRNRNT